MSPTLPIGSMLAQNHLTTSNDPFAGVWGPHSTSAISVIHIRSSLEETIGKIMAEIEMECEHSTMLKRGVARKFKTIRTRPLLALADIGYLVMISFSLKNLIIGFIACEVLFWSDSPKNLFASEKEVRIASATNYAAAAQNVGFSILSVIIVYGIFHAMIQKTYQAVKCDVIQEKFNLRIADEETYSIEQRCYLDILKNKELEKNSPELKFL